MNVDLAKAHEAIRRCRALRDKGTIEAILRGEFHSHLRSIFYKIGDAHWINHYGEGAEARTKVSITGGATANRFIDNLIGSTTVEYEADLRIAVKHNEGFG